MYKEVIKKWLAIIAINILISLLVIVLQFLYYGTAPAINPNLPYKDNFDKEGEAFRATMQFNKVLISEILIAALIVSLVNFFYFKKEIKKAGIWTLVFLLGFLLLTGFTLLYLSNDYIARNV